MHFSGGLFCAVIIKYGLTVVCAIAHVVSLLGVLPANVRADVLKLLQPQLSEDDAETLFKCVLKLNLLSLTSFETDQVHVSHLLWVLVLTVIQFWFATTIQ